MGRRTAGDPKHTLSRVTNKNLLSQIEKASKEKSLSNKDRVFNEASSSSYIDRTSENDQPMRHDMLINEEESSSHRDVLDSSKLT